MFGNQYLATVRDESQQVTKKLVIAKNQAKALALLQKDKYKVIAIEQRKSPFFVALKQGRLELGKPASSRELATFSNNLALMVQTKVNTANAFQTNYSGCSETYYGWRKHFTIICQLSRSV